MLALHSKLAVLELGCVGGGGGGGDGDDGGDGDGGGGDGGDGRDGDGDGGGGDGGVGDGSGRDGGGGDGGGGDGDGVSFRWFCCRFVSLCGVGSVGAPWCCPSAKHAHTKAKCLAPFGGLCIIWM